MNQCVVAISQRVDAYPERNETRDGLDQRLVEWVGMSGSLAFPVPNTLSADDVTAWCDVLRPDAIVLSGGADVGVDLARDRTERLLLDYAMRLRLPLLGLCRGMQMMTIWLGGTLKPVEGHVCRRHRLQGQLTGEVNSFHELGIVECPPECEVLASAEDGEIEAIRHVSLPWQGWMWHPEREVSFAAEDIERGRAIFTSRITTVQCKWPLNFRKR